MKELPESGIIEPSRSKWSSPIVVGKEKKRGNIRLCIDYCRLNSVTSVDLMSRTDELIDHLGKVYHYSRFIKRIWKVPMKKEDRTKTTPLINTPN